MVKDDTYSAEVVTMKAKSEITPHKVKENQYTKIKITNTKDNG